MAVPRFFDRVKESTTTTGTGDITLAGAQTGGFVRFQDVLSVNDTCYYTIQLANQWEVGLGTLSALTNLQRTTILASSNANAAVNFSAGTKDIWLDVPASILVANSIVNTFTVGPQTIQTGANANKGIIVKANSVGQTANLQEWQDSTGALLLSVGSAGALAATGAVTGSNLSGTNTGDQTITLTGDVTGSGTGSFAATIAANAVTNAKAAQMPAKTLKGNNTAGTANAADLTAAQAYQMLLQEDPFLLMGA